MLPIRARRRQMDVILLLAGVLAGWLTVQILQTTFLQNRRARCRKINWTQTQGVDITFSDLHNHGHAGSSTGHSSRSQSKELLLVGVMTKRRDLATRGKAIMDTWGKDIQGRVIFYIGEGESLQTDTKSVNIKRSSQITMKDSVSAKQDSLEDSQRNTRSSRQSGYVQFINDMPAVVLHGVSDDTYPPQTKSFAMLRHMHVHFGQQFHWFMRADDDVMVRPEYLSRFLSSIKSSKAWYLGQPGEGVPGERGKLGLKGGAPYCMGGPGVLLSAPTLRLLVPHLDRCLKETVTSHEDTELGRCLQHHVNITCSRSAQMRRLFYQNYRDKNGSFTGKLDPKVFSALTLHPVKDARHMYRLYVLLETGRLKVLQHKEQRHKTAVDAFKELGVDGSRNIHQSHEDDLHQKGGQVQQGFSSSHGSAAQMDNSANFRNSGIHSQRHLLDDSMARMYASVERSEAKGPMKTSETDNPVHNPVVIPANDEDSTYNTDLILSSQVQRKSILSVESEDLDSQLATINKAMAKIRQLERISPEDVIKVSPTRVKNATQNENPKSTDNAYSFGDIDRKVGRDLLEDLRNQTDVKNRKEKYTGTDTTGFQNGENSRQFSDKFNVGDTTNRAEMSHDKLAIPDSEMNKSNLVNDASTASITTKFTSKQIESNSSTASNSLLTQRTETAKENTHNVSQIQNNSSDATAQRAPMSDSVHKHVPPTYVTESNTRDNMIWEFIDEDCTVFSLRPLVHPAFRVACKKAHWHFRHFRTTRMASPEPFGSVVAKYQAVSVTRGLQHLLITSVNNFTRSVSVRTLFEPLQWREVETYGNNGRIQKRQDTDPQTEDLSSAKQTANSVRDSKGKSGEKKVPPNDGVAPSAHMSGGRHGARWVNDQTEGSSRDLWLLLSLCNRYRAYVRFLQYLADAAKVYPGNIYLRVALFPDPWANHERSLLLSDQYRLSPETRLVNLDIKVHTMNLTFSRAKAFHDLAAGLDENALLILMDVDLVLTSGFLFRVARNAGPRRAYFPVIFAQYYPETVCYGLTNCTPEVFDFSADAGTWRHFSYGTAALTAGDLRRVGGLDTTIKGWGKEDVDLYSRCVSKGLYIMRAIDPGLVHVHHRRSCDPKLARDQLRMCGSSLVALYGSIHKLAQIVMDKELTVEDRTEVILFT